MHGLSGLVLLRLRLLMHTSFVGGPIPSRGLGSWPAGVVPCFRVVQAWWAQGEEGARYTAADALDGC